MKGCDKDDAAVVGQTGGVKIPRYRRGESIIVRGLKQCRLVHVDDIRRWLSIYAHLKVIRSIFHLDEAALINFIHYPQNT